jgi:predicted ATPase
MVVLTGGPGGGKTAILELARHYFCRHVVFLPEAASIVFGGGFPRNDSEIVQRAGQRAIFFLQREFEAIALAEHRPAMIVCDRGTIDGLAYWSGAPAKLFSAFHANYETELARYAGVIHVETPGSTAQYRRSSIRKESMRTARQIDERIAQLWSKHPNHMTVSAQQDFLDKARHAITTLQSQLPACCMPHKQENRKGRA